MALAQFSDAARRALPFWKRTRPKRPGTARRRAYKAFLKSPEWRATRLRILERDGHRCQGEGCGEPATTVNHKSYRPILAETPDSELEASCTRCNLAERERRIAGGGRAAQQRSEAEHQGGNQWRGVTRARPRST